VFGLYVLWLHTKKEISEGYLSLPIIKRALMVDQLGWWTLATLSLFTVCISKGQDVPISGKKKGGL